MLQQVSSELGLYVYMLVDPRNGLPFYVGKGQGLRFSSHDDEADAASGDAPEENDPEMSEKIERIREIWASSLKHEVWILRHGMTTKREYTAVEAAAIDLLHSFPLEVRSKREPVPESFMDQLTNARRESSKGHGIMLLNDLVAEKAAPELTLTEVPMLLITLKGWIDKPEEPIPGEETRDGYGYKREWLTSSVREQHFEEIGRSVCAWWRIDLARVERNNIEYAVAVHRGVTRAVFRILPGTWEEQGGRRGFQFEPVTRDDDTLPDLYDEVVGPYGHRIPEKKKGDMAPLRYWPYSC
ncbi:hypothetical protein HMPREF2550_02660 [Corynebacterium sp. HMSC074A01]|nr:hypothetical protein HMPREF2550_02660 [Corynebacterium sp. HMSC074A01]